MPRVEINGRMVEFARPPTPEDINYVAAMLRRPPRTSTATTQPVPDVGQPSATGTTSGGTVDDILKKHGY